MQTWNNAPELEGIIEVARSALIRTQLAFGLESDLVSAAQSLGTRIWLAALRMDPDALRNIEDYYGPEAAARAFEYLSECPSGFPKEPLAIPRHRARDKRRTPGEVRALWRICEAAVQETFAGLVHEVELKLVLHLSWGVHMSAYQKHTRYREKVKEMRRLTANPRRISGSFPAASIVLLLASGGLLIWGLEVLPSP